MTTRRQFLGESSVLALSLALTPEAALAHPYQARERDLDQISFRAFASSVGNGFQMSQGGYPRLRLVLVQARPELPIAARQNAPAPTEDEHFSLLFQGPLDQPVEQGTHWFEHPRIGRFAMFIVPIYSSDLDRLHYEAVFNRPVEFESLTRRANQYSRHVN